MSCVFSNYAVLPNYHSFIEKLLSDQLVVSTFNLLGHIFMGTDIFFGTGEL